VIFNGENKKLYNELTEHKKNLMEVFEDDKKEVIELMNGIGYEKMLVLDGYTIYNSMLNIAKEIYETDIKLRTLRHLLKD